MGLIFRWSFRLFMALAALALLSLFVIYYLASRSLPDYSATYDVPGLTAPVEIVRNNSGVPHIFGQTDADVFYGLGFAHAQDRLWQMMMMRRTVQGRLSELFGRRTLETDTLMRRLDLYGHAQRSAAQQTPETRAALAAYSAGVNAWLRTINEQALGRGAPEFFWFRPEIAPWRPTDSIALQKLRALQDSAHMAQEVLRTRLFYRLPEERLPDILPDDPSPGVAALDFAALLDDRPDIPQVDVAQTERDDPFWPLRPRAFAGASNSFAAAPIRSAAGGTLLANDPHNMLSAPSMWYLARLELQSGGVIGATMPGIPLVLSGRSAQLGWGITSAFVDDQDLFFEQVNPANEREYQTPDGYKPFRTRQSLIEIRDELAETVTLRWTENGPVLPHIRDELSAIAPPDHVVTLNWTALSDDDRSIAAGLALMRTASTDEAIAAMESYAAPSMNLVLSDQENVALKTVGHIPKRDAAHSSLGRVPSRGWLAENRWQGIMAYADNPQITQAEGGIVGNTNNKVVDRAFPDHVSYFYGDTQRVQRWRNQMLDRRVHTRDSFIETQLDTVSFTARTLLPLIGGDLWFTGEAAPEGTPERQRQRALELMAAWNGEMSEHLPEPLIYAAWLRALQGRLIRDDLGLSLAAELAHADPVFIERVYRDLDGASAWCDIRQSAPVETCSDIARLALDDALIELQERFGANIESWRWGDAHEAAHDHQVMGQIPLLSWFVNIRQSTSGGDNTLMRGLTSGTGENPYLNIHAAGFRGVYDFADPDSSVFVIATGQSGHPLSRHYDDLGVLWRRGEYIPMSLDPALARAASVGITTLTPR